MRISFAVILVVFSAAATAADLGTLFHTPKEREALERLRGGQSAGAGGGAVAIPRPNPVITGYVKRSDGKSVVFIDKQPYSARAGRIQDRLEPRIVERYEPAPEPSWTDRPARD